MQKEAGERGFRGSLTDGSKIWLVQRIGQVKLTPRDCSWHFLLQLLRPLLYPPLLYSSMSHWGPMRSCSALIINATAIGIEFLDRALKLNSAQYDQRT